RLAFLDHLSKGRLNLCFGPGSVTADLELYGLHISPDLDIVMYTLADLVCEERGWGVRGDSFNCLSMLSRYGLETWFRLGDMDLATHIYRTHMLRQGLTLSQVTFKLCRRLGLKVKLIPVTDHPLRTFIVSEEGYLSFQEYFVRRRCEPKVLNVVFDGVDEAEAAPGVLEALEGSDIIVICPSNPILSIGPILAVRGVRKALRRSDGRVVAITPLIAGKTVKGPADKMMVELGLEPTALGVAKLYKEFLDVFVLDVRDCSLKPKVESLGVGVAVTDTLMVDLASRIRLARETLKAALKA
ncbi:TPA: 2-phospho-L-lactate transferase, partial [Candidatus Bathyarchaeota archaeon]|nr:2-phospho-L-lactate transferase [Candidatus Bathyarchaeota archaeon]